MYFGEPYKINLEDTRGEIVVYSPTIGELIEVGEKRFYQTLNVFCTNTTANRLMLWEAGIDWNEISDFELFSMLIMSADPEVCKIFFKDLDIQKFERMGKNISEDKQVLVLYDKEDDIEIDENVYFHLSQYLRNIFNYFPEEQLTKSSHLKQWYIDKDKRQRTLDEEKAKKQKTPQSFLQSQVSSYINHPGTKYKLHELKEVGVCEFFDSLQRLQIYESATACMKGMYSGFVDGKKIKPEDYNFMRDIHK